MASSVLAALRFPDGASRDANQHTIPSASRNEHTWEAVAASSAAQLTKTWCVNPGSYRSNAQRSFRSPLGPSPANMIT